MLANLLVREGRVRLAARRAPHLARLALGADWLFGPDRPERALLSRWLVRHGQRAAGLSLSHGSDMVALSLLGMHAAAARLLPVPIDDVDTACAAIRSLSATDSNPQAIELLRTALSRWPRQRASLMRASMQAPPEALLPFARGEPDLEAALMHAIGRCNDARATLAAASGDLAQTPDIHLLRASLARDAGDLDGATRHINGALYQHGLRPVSLTAGQLGIAGICCDTVPTLGEPLVSIVMPIRNVANLIDTALESVLAQDHRELQVIVVDDASDDGTAERVSRIASIDKRVTLIRQIEQRGAYCARNRGLAEAEGEYVTFHDGDDWSHPQKITEHRRALELNARAVASVSNWVRMRDDGTFIARQVYPLIRMNTSSLMFRRLVLERAGLFDEVRTGADSEYQARLECTFGGSDAVVRVHKLLSFSSWRRDSLMNDPATGYSTSHGARQRLEYWESWNYRHLRQCKDRWNNLKRIGRRNCPSTAAFAGNQTDTQKKL